MSADDEKKAPGLGDELANIEPTAAIERSLLRSDIWRRGVALFIGLLLVASGYYLMHPSDEKQWSLLLDALGYEAIAMAEDPSGQRLYLPSQDQGEILQYLQSSPGLSFSPRVLASLANGWVAAGAAVIDYEARKVAVVQYERASDQQKLFFFTLAGELKLLPAAKPANDLGFIYQPYASDRINMIAWQDNSQTLGVLAGFLSMQELAQVGREGQSLPPKN